MAKNSKRIDAVLAILHGTDTGTPFSMVKRTCPICGQPFFADKAKIAKGYGTTDSRSCAAKYQAQKRKEQNVAPPEDTSGAD